MSDRNPNLPIFRFLIAAAPVLAAAVFLAFNHGYSLAAVVVIAIVSLSGAALAIYRYERDIVLIWRDTKVRLQSAANDLNTAHLLTSIVEGISDPLILLDRNRIVVEANRAARELLGDKIVGQDIAFHLRHPDALQAVEKAIRDGASSELEITLLDPIERDCLMRVNIIRPSSRTDSDAPQQFVIISIYDVSKIKLAEKMRVDFVANASHELRTPLASLSGFIETLQTIGDKDPETRAKFLKIMESEASRMRRLIDDLLSLSRIEMDQHVPPDQAVDVVGVLKSVAHAMDLRLHEKNASFAFNVAPDIPEILGDRDQLVQVFTNLFDNALKYGNHDAPIEVTVRRCDRLPNRGGPGVMISVFNAGEGIPPEHLPRLTERFYRVDAARSRILGGTGLGLAIVKHIVNRHRGFLKIESTIGVGTIVSVGLPKKNDTE